jgi:hypothetical protein
VQPLKARKPLPPSHPDDESGPAPSSGEASAPAIPGRFHGGRPRPIGPEALKALREAIRNGTYPTDGAVESGILRMFRKP